MKPEQKTPEQRKLDAINALSNCCLQLAVIIVIIFILFYIFIIH